MDNDNDDDETMTDSNGEEDEDSQKEEDDNELMTEKIDSSHYYDFKLFFFWESNS